MKTIMSLFICLALFGKPDYHKQMDYNEYTGNLKPSLQEYFSGYDIRNNFCGEMTLLNVMDIMSQIELGSPSDMNVVDMLNQYFTEDGEVIFAYKNSDRAANPNGSMNNAAMYWMADKIGADKNLWTMSLIYGTNNSTWNEPVLKNDLSLIVDEMQDVFDQNGVIIMGVNIKGSNGKIAYAHWITVLGAKMNDDGSAQLLIIDSLGKDRNGYYGWVNSEEYLTYDQNKYTGINEVFGVIPVK